MKWRVFVVALLCGSIGIALGAWAVLISQTKPDDWRPDMARPAGFVFVELYTQDIRGHLSFFQQVVGFRVKRDEGDFAELQSDTAVILLNGDKDADIPEGHPFRGKMLGAEKGVGVEIGIVLADLPTARQKALTFRGWSVSEISRQEWGLSDFRVVTPDGYYLRFTDTPAE